MGRTRPVPSRLKRRGRSRLRREYHSAPHLDDAQVRAIAVAISTSRFKRMTWDIVAQLAERETGFPYTRQTLSAKPAIAAAYADRRLKVAVGAPSKVSSRRSGDIVTETALQAQLILRDQIIAQERAKIAKLESEMQNLVSRYARLASNVMRRTTLSEEDLDQPIQYMPRR